MDLIAEMHVERRGRCPRCKRRVRRMHTVSALTIDPATRCPRTRRWIKERLDAEARRWRPDFTHKSCRERKPPR